MSFFEQISLKNNFNASLNIIMWQVYTRPTSASDFFLSKIKTKFEISKTSGFEIFESCLTNKIKFEISKFMMSISQPLKV
jgi:hypothetical protein